MFIFYFSGVKLLQPTDKHKDQTFFLSQVKQFSLRKCMFPIANLLKSQVRDIAKSEGLINVAKKKDSTGICFIGKRRFQDFIEEVSIENTNRTIYKIQISIQSSNQWTDRPKICHTDSCCNRNQ